MREATSNGRKVEGVEEEDAAWEHVSVLLTDLMHNFMPENGGYIGRLFRRSLQRRAYIDEELLSPIKDRLERQKEKLERTLVGSRTGVLCR